MLATKGQMKQYFVYILSNKARMLYVGVTSNLDARLWQHRMRLMPGWPEHYGVFRLVFFEVTENVMSAIEREKEIKGWVRRKKVALISSANPEWKDLSEEWAAPHPEILRSAQDDKEGAHEIGVTLPEMGEG